MSGRTIREAYREASSLLSKGGVEEAARHAEMLIQEILGWDRTQFLLRSDEPFPEDQTSRLEAMLARRLNGEPLQYIIGEQEFYGLPFRVNPAVLIPRPETELLVEEVMKRGRAMAEGTADVPRVLDIGTGSGAIAVTLAVLCPEWRITASDISREALQVAEENAERNGVGASIEWVQGDLLSPWLGQGEDRFQFDIVVSNPPYIPEEEIESLQTEVRKYEPHTALSGGSDGLRIYARLVEQLKSVQRKPRIVAFEVGYGQHEDVGQMLTDVGAWDEVVFVQDLAGIQRHVIAVRTMNGSPTEVDN